MTTAQGKWELVSWNSFYDLARQLAFLVMDDNYRPDIIIAIARGGYAPARILSDYLGVMDMTSFKVKHYIAGNKQPEACIEHPLAADLSGQKVLLVDDVSDSGGTFEIAIEHIQSSTTRPAETRTAVLHHKTVSRYRPQYYTREVKDWHWITYPWAVIEDMTGFIRKMQPPPESVEDIAQRLRSDYDMEVPAQILSDAMKLIERHTRPAA